MSFSQQTPEPDYVRDVTSPYPRDGTQPETIEFNSPLNENPVISFKIVRENNKNKAVLTLSMPVEEMTMKESCAIREFIGNVPHIFEDCNYENPNMLHLIHVQCTQLVDSVEETLERTRVTEREMFGPVKFVILPNVNFQTPVIGLPGSDYSRLCGLPNDFVIIDRLPNSEWTYEYILGCYRFIHSLPKKLRKAKINKQLIWAIMNDAFTRVQWRQALLLSDASRNDPDLHTY
jgi:hypothetical protein